MAEEHVLNPELQDADKEQEQAPQKEESKIQINLVTSVIITPLIKFIGEMKTESKGSDPTFSLVVVTDAIKLKFMGKTNAIRGLKAGLLNALTQNQVYIVNVSESLVEEGDLIYEIL